MANADGRICKSCKKIKAIANLCHKCGQVVCVDCCIGSRQSPECPRHQFRCKSCNVPYNERCEGGCEDCNRDICVKCAIAERQRTEEEFTKSELEALRGAVGFALQDEDVVLIDSERSELEVILDKLEVKIANAS